MIRQRGLKQYWVATEIGLTESYFSHILTGRRAFPPDKLGPLAKVLGVTKRDITWALQGLETPKDATP